MSEFMKRLGKGVVMVGEPYECGWYEEEGYHDDWLIVDDEVMLPKSKVREVLKQALDAFPKKRKKIYEIEQDDENIILTECSYDYKEIDEWLKTHMGGIPKASD